MCGSYSTLFYSTYSYKNCSPKFFTALESTSLEQDREREIWLKELVKQFSSDELQTAFKREEIRFQFGLIILIMFSSVVSRGDVR